MMFARATGEFGSVIFIAGNIPMESEILPLIITGKLEQYDVQGASAVALFMLLISFFIYWKKRQRKGITQINARRLMRERNYFGAMLVNTGQADAMITGYSRSYPQVIRPILDLVEKEEGFSRIAATSILITKRGPLFLSDTTMNPNPSSEDLISISLAVAEKAH